jgi:hypothetical protein
MGLIPVLFIFICIIPFIPNRNALFWCIKTIGAKTLLLLSMYASWSVGPVGGCWISLYVLIMHEKLKTRIIQKRETRKKSPL